MRKVNFRRNIFSYYELMDFIVTRFERAEKWISPGKLKPGDSEELFFHCLLEN